MSPRKTFLESFLGFDSPRSVVIVPSVPRMFRFEQSASAVADAAGVATITFDGPPVGHRWLIDGAGVVGGGATGTATFYRYSVSPTNVLAVADPADLNAAHELRLDLTQSVLLVVVVTGAAVGATVTVRIEGEVRPG